MSYALIAKGIQSGFSRNFITCKISMQLFIELHYWKSLWWCTRCSCII